MEYSGNTLGLVIQGGAVGICVLLIIKDYWKDKMFNKTLNNHFQHDTDAKIELAKAIVTLADRIK